MMGVTFVQRVATKGGVAPAEPCASGVAGKKSVVKYQADYIKAVYEHILALDALERVTAGGVNPTNTICSLALRFADRLVERRAHQRVPA